MRRFAAPALGAVLLLGAHPAAAVQVLSNGVYTVNLGADGDDAAGSWNAVTAAGHPAGEGHDLLYDGEIYETNYSSLRVWNSDDSYQDYATAFTDGAQSLAGYLDAQGPSPYGEVGWQLQWLVPGGVRVTQDVVIPGLTFSESAIYHSVRLANEGDAPVTVAWRNLYDWAVHDPNFDDGPANQIERLDGTVVVSNAVKEFDRIPGTGEFVRVGAYPLEDGREPTYEALLALGFDPGFLPGLPVTRPDQYAFVSWPHASATTYDYFVDPDLLIAVPFAGDGQQVIDDTAGLSWFGPVTLAVGASVTYTQAIFGVLPGEPPPSPVPEPGTLTLVATGLGLLGVGCRRRSSGRVG